MKCSRTFEVGDHRMEPAIRVTWRAEKTQAMRFLAQAVMYLGGDPRLADPGLPGQQHDSACAGLCLAPASKQKVELLVATNDRDLGSRVQRLKSTLDVAGAQCLPRPQRLGQTFHLDGSKVAVLEIARGEPFRIRANENGVRVGQPL